MKRIIIKALILFILSTFIVYTLFTFFRLQIFCNKYQIELFVTHEIDTSNLDNLKLKAQGEQYVERLKSLVTTDSNLSKYDLTGYAFWLQMQSFIGDSFSYYIYISFLLGLSISIGYLIVNISKLKVFLKILIGYIFPIIIFSICYILIFNVVYNPFMSSTDRNKNILLYIVSYTIIFITLLLLHKNKKKVTNN